MDGILVVDKPQGFTSHDVVAFIRSRFNLKKVGHAGTLDPMATGVLVILIGKYTKYSDQFLNDSKEYDATMTLGAISDTGDAWGRIKPFPGPGLRDGKGPDEWDTDEYPPLHVNCRCDLAWAPEGWT